MTSYNPVTRPSSDYIPESQDGRIRLNGIYVGIIKANQDVQRMGRLSVYIPDLGGDPTEPNNWYVVGYASPFAGATNLDNNKADGKDLASTQQSYGMWMIPPDIENQVLCCFVNGDTARGFWFACLYQQFMNHMVPGLAVNHSTVSQDESKGLPPVAEYNKKDTTESANYWNPKRPTYSPLKSGFDRQGLNADPERGPASTSARREAPSQVFGFSTPRGNSFSIDDNPDNELIRIRTRSGAQILLSETTGYIYMISREGNSWVEISDIGIDMYSKRSISLRAEENINLHADSNVIIHAKGAFHSTANSVTQCSHGGITHVACKDIQHTTQGKHTIKAKDKIQHSSQDSIIHQADNHIVHEATNGSHVTTAKQDVVSVAQKGTVQANPPNPYGNVTGLTFDKANGSTSGFVPNGGYLSPNSDGSQIVVSDQNGNAVSSLPGIAK